MRKILCSFLLLMAFIAFNCTNSTGPSGTTTTVPRDVIDISHDGTSGFTFGLHGADQLKRFQTFIADTGRLNITGIDIKIRKNDSSDTYQNITAELYETAGNLPTNLLAISSIDVDSLGRSFTVKHAPLKYSGLIAGQTYAVVIGQSNVLANTNPGFEWCTKSVDTNLCFGKYNGTSWVDESGLGDGWLKVYANKTTGSNEYSFAPGTQVVFFDDFQRTIGKPGNGWIDRQGGSLVDTFSCKIINDGTDNKAMGAKRNVSLANGDSSWSDYTLYARVKKISSSNAIAFQFRYKDGNNTYETIFNENELFLSKYVSGWSDLDTASISCPLNIWHNLKITVSGSNIKVYLDNLTTPAIDYSDASAISNGKIGVLFWASQPDMTLIDDVLVTIP